MPHVTTRDETRLNVKDWGTGTDFRGDLAAFTLPTLIIHGTSDKVVPIDATGRVSAQMIPGAQLLEYDGAPHGLFVTHKEQLTSDLLTFLRA